MGARIVGQNPLVTRVNQATHMEWASHNVRKWWLVEMTNIFFGWVKTANQPRILLNGCNRTLGGLNYSCECIDGSFEKNGIPKFPGVSIPEGPNFGWFGVPPIFRKPPYSFHRCLGGGWMCAFRLGYCSNSKNWRVKSTQTITGEWSGTCCFSICW